MVVVVLGELEVVVEVAVEAAEVAGPVLEINDSGAAAWCGVRWRLTWTCFDCAATP